MRRLAEDVAAGRDRALSGRTLSHRRSRCRMALLSACSLVTQGTASYAQQAGPTPELVHRDLREILSRPEFHQGPSPVTSWISRVLSSAGRALATFLRWLGRLVGGLFHFHFRVARQQPFLFRGLVYLGIGVLAALAVWVLARVISAWRRARTGRAKTPVTKPQLETTAAPITPPDEWMRRAEELASSGDYLLAVRALFMALLLELDRRRLVPYDASATNGEYLRALRRLGYRGLLQPSAALVRTYDRLWYGSRHADAQDYHSATHLLLACIAALDSSPEAGRGLQPGAAI